MAFVSDPTQDNSDPAAQQAQEQQARLVNSNPATGGGTAIFGAPGGGGAATSGNPAPKSNSSGTFTNLQAYLDANKDQAAGMGQKLADSVGTKAAGAKSAVDNLANDFSTTVQQNTTNFDPTSVSKDIADATSLKAGGTYDPNDVKDFGKYAGAKYSGPNDLSQDSNYTGVAKQVSDAQNALGQAQSEAGRQQLLQQTYGQNGAVYNQGARTLDSALVEASPGAQKALGAVKSQWSGLGSLLGQANTAASAKAQQAQATDAATAKAAADALGGYSSDAAGTGGKGALGDWSKGIYGQTDAASKAYGDTQTALTAAEQSGQWTPEQLQALGLSMDTHNYGVNLGSNYITPGANAPGMANVANADQYAQQVALAKLAGVLPGGAAAIGNPLLNQANASQAGTAAGVNGNAMATLSPTYLSDVAAAKAGVGNSLFNAFNTYAQGIGMDLGGDQLVSYDPNTLTAQISHGAVNVQGRAGDQGPGTQYISLDPNAETYAGGANPEITAGGMNGFVGLDSSPAWQQLLAQVNGTIGNKQLPNIATSGGVGPQIRGARFAHGGEVAEASKILTEKVPSPPKEPGIPKMPKADAHLPKLPRFAEGGTAGGPKYPVHTPDHAKASYAKVMQGGTPDEQAVVQRQIAAHHPSLAKELNFQSGGRVPGTPKVDHNSYSNDTVHALLSPKEVVLPLSVTQSRDPVRSAADFMASILAGKAGK